MENELGIKICCENCMVKNSMCIGYTPFDCEICLKRDYALFNTSLEAMENRIRELQTELEKINRLYDYKQDLYRDLCIRYEEAINHNKTKGQK